MAKSFKGAITELMTPYNDDFTINYDGLRQEIEFQIKSGIAGLFTNGIASECLFMTPEEQKSLMKFVAQTINGRVPLMANIWVSATSTALDLLDFYQSNGADAICIVQPCTYPITESGLYEHYTALIKRSQLPVYIYNAPQTQNTMSPGLVARLMNENENVKGYKESTQDLVHFQTMTKKVKREGLEYLSGSDATILPIMQTGGCGVVSLISVVFPQPIIDLCDAVFANDRQRAIECQHKVLSIREVLKSAPAPVAAYKYTADLLGIFPGGKSRAPLTDANYIQRQSIREALYNLGLVSIL